MEIGFRSLFRRSCGLQKVVDVRSTWGNNAGCIWDTIGSHRGTGKENASYCCLSSSIAAELHSFRSAVATMLRACGITLGFKASGFLAFRVQDLGLGLLKV